MIDEKITNTMWELNKKLKRSKLRFLHSFGLTSSQMEIMGFLYQNLKDNPTEEITQINISKSTYIDPMTTSTVIKNLEKKELIYRLQSKVDSRALCVCLSDKGKKLCDEINNGFIDFKRAILKDVDKESFYQQLTILLSNIKNNNNIIKCE